MHCGEFGEPFTSGVAVSQSRYTLIPSAAIADDRLTPIQLRVLLAIGSFTSKDQECFPKQKTIADLLGIARETVNRACARLVELGYVAVEHQYRADGGQRENLYRVILDPCDRPVTPPVTANDHTPRDPTRSHPRTTHKNNLTSEADASDVVDAHVEPAPATPDRARELRRAEEGFRMFVVASQRQPNWATPTAFSDSRKAALKARIRKIGLEGWQTAIERAEQSSFLTGRTGKPFCLAIDWLLKPANLTKVMEGNYDDRSHSTHLRASPAYSPSAHTRGHGARSNPFERLERQMAGDTERSPIEPDPAGGSADSRIVDVEFSVVPRDAE
ncbi:helix-turn-helix domain-containing protein [Hyphomonas sp.]|uniref:helix-turn-helix domain-containing protein n=1 Tax=Hyphomonas sp. TaxID=87 RepID=UPI00345BD976